MRVDVHNEKIILDRLNQAPALAFGAVRKAMARVGMGVHRSAYDFLSGKKTDTGGTPIPVVTGNLRRMLDWLKPGESKYAGGMTVVAGPYDTIVYDTAAYAEAVAKGKGSSAKFGPRDFLAGALDDFNSGKRIDRIMDEEMRRALA
jgi:hypothetical protein